MIGVVLGDARCVDDDFARATDLFRAAGVTPDAIAATNNMGLKYEGPLDYWFTLHPTECKDWPGIVKALELRAERGLNRPQTWGHRRNRGIDRWTPDWSGSTGLLAVKGLIEEGFTRIVLAGVPLTAEQGHFYNDRPWLQAERFHKGWKAHLPEIAPIVRSMSGWTRDLLGAPDTDWLNADRQPAR